MSVVLEDISDMPSFDESLEDCLKTAKKSRPEIKESQIKAPQAEHLVAIEKSAITQAWAWSGIMKSSETPPRSKAAISRIRKVGM